jgi:very-short-patch-repair endonuclease
MPEYTTNHHKYPIVKTLVQRSKTMSRQMTQAEKIIWFKLLKNHVFKWQKQKIIDPYILDFFCYKLSLGIEIDGEEHTKKQLYDLNRTKFLNSMKIQIIRFTDHDILYNFNQVINQINQITING